MRERLAEAAMQTDAYLTGSSSGAVIDNSFTWITTVAQMGMGFILPFALTFVAIPMETFVHSLRTVMGVIGVAMLNFLAWFLRLIGNVSYYLGRTLTSLYDVIIFAPLGIERLVKGAKGKSKSGSARNMKATSY